MWDSCIGVDSSFTERDFFVHAGTLIVVKLLTAAVVESTKDEIMCLEREVKSREKKFQENSALPTNFVESF